MWHRMVLLTQDLIPYMLRFKVNPQQNTRSVLSSSAVNKVGRRLTVSKEGLFRHSNIIDTRSIHKVSWDSSQVILDSIRQYIYRARVRTKISKARQTGYRKVTRDLGRHRIHVSEANPNQLYLGYKILLRVV